MNRSKTDNIAKRNLFAIVCIFLVFLLFPFVSKGNTFSFFNNFNLLDTCPIIGSFADLEDVCTDEVFSISVTDLEFMDSLSNEETDYGIEFIYFSNHPTDPYLGGTSLGLVDFDVLQNGNIATLSGLSFPSPGTFEIYAILNPIPLDTLCRPFAFDTLIVNFPPSALISLVDPFCPTDTTGSISLQVGGTGPFTFEWFSIDGTGLEDGQEDQTNLSGGIYQVTITDATAAACQNDYTVFLNDEDTTPPEIDCPGNITHYLGSGECEVVLSFGINVFDECTFFTGEPTINQIDNTGLSSGSFFPIGITTLEYEATDASGNIANCSFQIEVIEEQNPDLSLTCNNGVGIGLDQNCFAIVGAGDVLTGGPYTCFDNYLVELFYDEAEAEVVPSSPEIGPDEVGLTIFVRVSSLANNNVCTSSINVQDNIIPDLQCNSYEVLCTDNYLPGAPGISFPFLMDVDITPTSGLGPFIVTGFDPCGEVNLSFSDTEEAGDCLTDDYIRKFIRTWIAEDASGNTTSCNDTLTVLRAALTEVQIPENRDDISGPALSCSEEYELDANGNPAPSVTGFPTINGVEIIDDALCEIAAVYDDNISEICDGTHKVIRTWTVVKWCPTTEFFNDIQIITIKDDQGPILSCPEDVTIGTSQNNCLASVILPTPNLSDQCAASTPTLEIEASQGVLDDMTLYNLPLGETLVTYTVSDDCENQSQCDFIITIEDDVAPVSICSTMPIVALSNAGLTLVNASVFDGDSFDNCSNVTFLARRLNNPDCESANETDYDVTIPFYCCDVNSDFVLVDLLITDETGNSNSCQLQVQVQDNINPVITCPTNIVLDCGEDFTNLNLTGQATATDNCEFSITYSDLGELDECNEGLILRLWEVVDSSGNSMSCIQEIEVINSEPFLENDITWPQNYSTNNCVTSLEPEDLPLPFQMPDYTDGACDLISQEHEDLYLPVQDPACITILRTWTVYSWCIYDANDPESDGIWTHTQVIEVVNTEAPQILTDCSPLIFCSDDENCMLGFAQFSLEAIDDCTDSLGLNYSYQIDLFVDGSIDQTGDSFEWSGEVPLGNHNIFWEVEDACGNISSCEQLFTISDCQAPTVNLLNGLAIEMGTSTQIELSATVWDNPASPSNDNCGINQWLIYSPSLGPGQTSPPVEADTSWFFDCDDIGTQNVDIWVEDINGNWSFVSSYVLIQDNDFPPDCPVVEFMTISGILETEEFDLIEHVIMEVQTNAPGIPDMIYSDSLGAYAYPALIPGGNYMITPAFNETPLNGVSTYDLVLMSQHVLEVDTLESPYKIIAADINNSGTVSTFDMVQLRRLILFVDTVFQNNTSWRFVDAEYVFPNLQDPWEEDFPEYFEAIEIQDSMTADFVGIKIGDLNASATTNGFQNDDSGNESSSFYFKTKDFEFQIGEEVEISLTCDQFNEIFGFQSTITFDPTVLSFTEIENKDLEQLNADCFGFSFLEKGIITLSWFNGLGSSLNPEEEIFSMKFKAKQIGRLSEVFDLKSDLIKSEIYNRSSNQTLGLLFENQNMVFDY